MANCYLNDSFSIPDAGRCANKANYPSFKVTELVRSNLDPCLVKSA